MAVRALGGYWRAAGLGAAVGALLLGGAQAVATLWASLTGAGDQAAQRAQVAAGALGSHRLAFALVLVGAVAAVGAVLGAAQALLRRFAAGPVGPASLLRDAAWTSLVVAVLVGGRMVAVPALLGPALPAAGATAWLASWARPWFFHGLVLAGAASCLARGAWRARGQLEGAAVGSGSPPRSPPATTGYRRLWVLLPLLVLGSVLASRPQAPPPPEARPSVLILAVDSLRADHLSALGYHRPTTPSIDRLVDQGTLFSRAMAPLARTGPSWLSLLTGRYPHGHGVRHMFPGRRVRPRSLDTIAHAARRAGYRTSVFSDYAGDFFSTFALGFDHQVLPPRLDLRTVFERELVLRSPLAISLLGPLPEALRPRVFRYLMNGADPQRIAGEVIANLDATQADRPFFTVAFFSTSHIPFAAPYPWYRRFADPTYGGENRFAYDVGSLSDLARTEQPILARDVEQVVALYDGALAAVDAAVGRILAELERRDLTRSTLVVLLSDHGENLFEPGQTTLHGKWFRGGDHANRVPLVLRGPSVPAGLRVEQAVSLCDVAPTLADVLGWPALPRVEGRSLAPALRGQPLAERPVFAETGVWLSGRATSEDIAYPALLDLLEPDPDDGGLIVLRPRFEDQVVTAKHRAVWYGRHKLIYEPTPAGANLRFYDLAADPAQTRDLGADHADAALLRAALFEWLSRDREREVDLRDHVVRRRAG